jgi:hypothetical protein
LSRLRTFLLFAALAGLATVFAACGSSSSDSSGEDPQAVIEGATFKGIESAELEAKIGINVSGDEGGHLDIDVSGPFQGRGKGLYPEFDMTAKASGSIKGKDVDFEGGLVLLSKKAYVDYEGTDYEVDPGTFTIVKSAIERAQSQNGSSSSASTACQEAAAEDLEVSDFVENLTNEGSADVGGAGTTKVSGDIDLPSAIDAITELAEDPACSSQLNAAGGAPLAQLEEAKSQVEGALKSSHADVYVGDDNIVRKVATELSIEPEGSGEKVDLDIEVTLNGVNEAQSIAPPSGAQPLSKLFLKLGINPIELLEAGSGGAGGLGSILQNIE